MLALRWNLAWQHFLTHTHTCTQLLSGFSCWCLNGKTPLTCVRPPTGAPRVCVGSSSSVGECSALSCCSTGHFSHIFIFCVCMPRRLRLRAWKLNECLQANSGRFLVQNASVTRMERIFFFFFSMPLLPPDSQVVCAHQSVIIWNCYGEKAILSLFSCILVWSQISLTSAPTFTFRVNLLHLAA